MELGRWPLGLMPQGGDHGTDMRIARAGREDLEAAAGGAPYEDLDVDHPDAPVAHLAPVILIEIDGVRPDQRGAVVVDFAHLARLNDAEARADRVA